jgi:hypothetical protein
MTEQIKVDRSKLSADELKELDRWEQFFHGPIWSDMIERFGPEIDQLQNSYANVIGEQHLGRTQGALQIYYRIFNTLPDMIHTEFLLKTGQLGTDDEEDLSTEDPVSPEDWRR